MFSSQDRNQSAFKPSAQSLLRLGTPHKYGCLLQQHKTPKYTRLFTKKKKKWQSCYVIVAPNGHNEDARDCLFVYEDKDSNKPTFSSFASSFELPKRTSGVDGQEFCFILAFKEASKPPLLLACDTEQTLTEWIVVMNRILKADSDKGTSTIDLADSNHYTNMPQNSSHQGNDSSTSQKDRFNSERIDDPSETENGYEIPSWTGGNEGPTKPVATVGATVRQKTEKEMRRACTATEVKTIYSTPDQKETAAAVQTQLLKVHEFDAVVENADYENANLKKSPVNKALAGQEKKLKKTSSDHTSVKQKYRPEVAPKPEQSNGKKKTRRHHEEEEQTSLTELKTLYQLGAEDCETYVNIEDIKEFKTYKTDKRNDKVKGCVYDGQG